MRNAHGADLSLKKQAGFDLLAAADYGTLFPHAALAEIFQELPRSQRYYVLIAAVTNRLEREAQRTLHTVRGHGYRVALPKEHLDIAHGHHLRALRQKKRSVQILGATHTPSLDPYDQQRHQARMVIEQRHLSDMQQIQRKTAKVVQAQQKVQDAQKALQDFVNTKLQVALERIEKLEAQSV